MTASVIPWAILFLLLNLAAGLWRAWKGPSDGDRLLTSMLFSTHSVAILLLMAEWLAIPAIRTVALMLVLLATIVALAFFGMPERARVEADAGPADPEQDHD